MSLTQINKAGLDEIALDHVFTIGASGSDHYTFQGEGLNGTVNDPTLYLTRGKTYRFENGTGAHPIRIQSTAGASGTAYNTGVTNNAGSGTVIVEVQHDAPDVLYYQCTSHANMNGILYITGALADGGVTTAKLADDAVTDAKLANSINSAIAANTAKSTNATHTGDVTGSSSLTIANNAVTTAKIADEAVTLAKLEHGTGSNDGKFLRANNGADPSFETVSTDLVADTSPQLGGDLDANNKQILMVDSTGANNRIKLGASEDLQLYHNANNNKTYIGNKTSTDLVIENAGTNTDIVDDTGHYRARFIKDGAVELYHDNTKRISTNSGSYKGSIIHGDATNTSIAMQTESTTRGYFYANNTDQIGLLDAGGDWAIKHANDAYTEFRVGTATKATVNTHGLTFNGDTAAANALDDYEVGYFSPSYSMTGGQHNLTYHDQQGHYIKIGRLVYCQIYLRVNVVNANGNGYLFIAGLPFTTANNTQSSPGGEAYGSGAIAYTKHWNGDRCDRIAGIQNDTRIYIYNGTSGGTNVQATTANNIGNGTQFKCNFTYLTA